MSAHQAEFPIATMARVLGVPPSGYYGMAQPPGFGPCHKRRGRMTP